MPQRIEVPGIGIVEFPDGMTDEQIVAAIRANTAQPKQDTDSARKEMMQRELYSFLSPFRGVKDILDTGAYGLARLLGGKEEAERVDAENAAGKAKFAEMTSGSPVATVGRTSGQVAASFPFVNALGAGVGAVAPRVGQAITAGGFSSAPLPINMAGGAASGMLTAGLVDPSRDSVATGGVAGAVLPAIGEGASLLADKTSHWLMQSALKPTIKQLQSGDADVAIETLLTKGINPTKGGVSKLRALVDEKNSEIANAIAGSNATVNKFAALRPLSETAQKFTKQVNPTADLNAISDAGIDFLNHPAFRGTTIPVQDAQALKQGTYKILAKKYGQVGTADTEAQKAIARGLKDEIAAAVPGIKELNAQEQALLRTLDVAERRSLMELNKNPMGLALLANSPATWAAFIADRSAAFKSLAARMIFASKNAAGVVAPTAGRAVSLVNAEE